METAVHIEVKYTGAKELDDYSQYALGSYDYIGSLTGRNGPGIYIHSDKDHAKHSIGGRSVIIMDLLGSKTWIGTVRVLLDCVLTMSHCIHLVYYHYIIILKLQVALFTTLSFK